MTSFLKSFYRLSIMVLRNLPVRFTCSLTLVQIIKSGGNFIDHFINDPKP